MSPAHAPLLTLEPLIEAVTEGVEAAGWTLSGMQKTTSYEYEGRWRGESSRSAYLFFHAAALEESVSVDAFLDETSRGTQGNLALVIGGPELVDPRQALAALASAVRERIPRSYRAPVSLRLRLADAEHPPESATVEVRVKIMIPGGALRSGHPEVSRVSAEGVRAFEQLLAHPTLRRYGVGR